MIEFKNTLERLRLIMRKEIVIQHGLVINIKSVDYKEVLVERKLKKEIILSLSKEGFYIYGLRHKDSDCTDAIELTIQRCLINFMGFFITNNLFVYEGESFYINKSNYIDLNKFINRKLEIIINKMPGEISLCLDEIKVIRDNYEEFLRITRYVEFYLINIVENRDCFFIRGTEAEIENIRDYYELDMGYGTGYSYLIRSFIELEEFMKDIYIEEDDEDRRYNG